MPPLLCPSPIILDQSFPRDQRDLVIVAEALGTVTEYVQDGGLELILTQTLRDFVIDIDWSNSRTQGLLREIYVLLNQWFLRDNNNRLLLVDVFDIENHHPHPIPCNCENQGLIEIWSDEVGRILFLHDAYNEKGKFFIGIACAYAFAGEELSQYCNPNNQRSFPLVGPKELGDLDDAYDWDIPGDIHQKLVTFNDVMKNCKIIGGSWESPKSGGSHYKVKFEDGKRSWVLDPNVDPIPDRFLKQIADIIGKSPKFVKAALLTGRIPSRISKLDNIPLQERANAAR